MNDETPPRGSDEWISPDVHSLMEAARMKNAAERAERRSAEWSEAEAREAAKSSDSFYDTLKLAVLVVVFALCWIVAGLVLLLY